MKYYLLTVLALLTACGPRIEEFEGRAPKADIRQFFKGDLLAYGTSTPKNGTPAVSLVATLRGQWRGNQGTLDERFVYSDGTARTRTWAITMVDEHHFTARAGDVIGEAKGAQYGNAIRMEYTLFVLKNGKSRHLDVVDWIFLTDDNHAVNRNYSSTFGTDKSDMVLRYSKK